MHRTTCSIRTLFSCFVFFLVFFCFLTAASAADLTLAWDPNSESDLAGYKIYYKTGSSGAPYDGVDADQGSSGTTIPLENLSDLDNPRFTLTGLSEDTVYYLAVTAYNGQGSESGYSNEVSHLTVSADPVVTEYTITATSGANGSISPSGTTTVTRGAGQTYTITPAAGYHVGRVTVDGASVTVETAYSINTLDGSSSEGDSTYTFSNITADHTISANFAIDTHTITATAGEYGSISPVGTLVLNHGAGQVYNITPETGYHIADVLVDGVSAGTVAAYTFNNVSASHTISASFEISTHTITATAGPNGSISPAGQVAVQNNGDQIFSITPGTDSTIADVLVDGASVGAVTSYTFTDVTGNHVITASFQMANQLPTADAGPDQTVDEGVLVNLSGTNSFDLDDGIASFKWEQTNGTPVALSTPDNTRCAFLTPDVGQDGETFTFRLSVTDSKGAVSTDECIINTTWINEPPTADAGPDLNVNENDTITLDATQSVDEDDGIVSYQWIQIEGALVSLSDPATASPGFTAPDVGPAGAALKFQLTVADNGGLQAQDTCIVNICWQNQPPVSDAGVDQVIEGGEIVTLNGTGSTDPDDGISSYRWNQTSGTPVTLSDPTAITPTFTAPATSTDGEALNLTLTVTDTGGLQQADACSVTVSHQDMDTISPTVRITSPRIKLDYYGTPRTSIDVAGNASDNVGVSRVTWSNSAGGSGMASGTTKWKVKAMVLQRGYNAVTLTAEDAAGNQSSQRITIYRLR
jgi:hypothetical protein